MTAVRSMQWQWPVFRAIGLLWQALPAVTVYIRLRSRKNLLTEQQLQNWKPKNADRNPVRVFLFLFVLKPEIPPNHLLSSNVNNLWTTFFVLFFILIQPRLRSESDFCIAWDNNDNIRYIFIRPIVLILYFYSHFCRSTGGSFNKLSDQFLYNVLVLFLIIFRYKSHIWI